MPEPSTLSGSTATGFLWLMLQSLGSRLTSFLSQLVLAKLLLPRDFGQIGLAYTVITLISAFVSFGVDDILLQRLRTFHLWVVPAFWSSLGLAVIGMILMLLAAPVAAHLYGSPALVGLIAILSLSLPIAALTTVPAVKLRAEMNFRYLASYSAAETFGIQLASVILAAFSFGAYSFVLPLPIAALIKVAVFWRKAPARFRSGTRGVQYRYIVNNGLIVLATRLVIGAVEQGDYIVLGLIVADAVVGVYYFAFRLAAQPVRMLAGNFGSVIFPALTQLRGEPVRQEAAALQAARLLAYTVTPVCFVQAALASPVLHLMFGERWTGSIPLIQILSLGLPGDAIAWIGGALLVARKEFLRDLIYMTIFAVPFFAMVAAGAYLDAATGVAIAVSCYYAILKPINSWLVFRRSMRLTDILHLFVVPPFIAACATGVAWGFMSMTIVQTSFIVQICLIVIISPLLYLGLMRLLVPKILRDVLNRFPVHRIFSRAVRKLWAVAPVHKRIS